MTTKSTYLKWLSRDSLLPLSHLCLWEDHDRQGDVKGWPRWALAPSLPDNSQKYFPGNHCQLDLQSKLKHGFEYKINFNISVLAPPSNKIASLTLPHKATINAKIIAYWNLLIPVTEKMTSSKLFATLCHRDPNQGSTGSGRSQILSLNQLCQLLDSYKLYYGLQIPVYSKSKEVTG